MLKGHDKGIAGENVRELKKKGMSEREAVMTHMKHERKESKKDKSAVVSPSRGEDYPYGMRISLDHDSLEKLGMHEGAMPSVGDEMHIHAKTKVQRTSEDQHEGDSKKKRHIELQITHMKVKK